ncbi:hypothetical protein M3908_003570 [Vibrio metschnikovii]|uniref:hypothetical protein n=1 Tax=Vibrio metschnikovii TaxID=28172 RepID=UPI002A17454A|nr:hypothetical protein [Vibrio metschnikovii]EKO3657056.1 hypothetical protein [Vibrio metschnikovii]
MADKQNSIEPIAYVETALAEFWEQIYPNLEHIPIERKGSIYQYAKQKAIASVRPSRMAYKIV